MVVPTTRLALSKPDDPESQDITVLNGNADRIDKFMGAILTPAGITPVDADLFDGAIVKEKTTGIVWVAQWNGTGYDHKYITYPWFCRAKSGGPSATNFPSDYNYRIAPIWQTTGTQFNSTGALRSLATNNSTIDLPVSGVYQVRAYVGWDPTFGYPSGSTAAITIYRQLTAAFDQAPVQQFGPFADTSGVSYLPPMQTSWAAYFSANESIRVGVWQKNATNSTCQVQTVELEVTLLYPGP